MSGQTSSNATGREAGQGVRPWRAVAYARLSRDDGGEGVSGSIENQLEIIGEFSRSRGIELVGSYIDDGVSGTTFERPAFKRMIADAERGAFDTIIVKDQSRFGRNYLEMGRWVDLRLPQMGVRLYAIADDFDSMKPRDYGTAIMFPMKNIVGELYAATTSEKTKESLAVRRRQGICVASFAPYGYVKDPEDRGRLLVDDEAARVVRDIFRWRIEGMGAAAIAARLTDQQVPTPLALKRSRGSAQPCPFGSGRATARWSARQVIRILVNEVYLGDLVQGKSCRSSWRSRRRVRRPPEEWERALGAHEAIVDRRSFEVVAALARRDMRTPPGSTHVHLLSGLVFCGICGDAYCLRTTVRGEGEDQRRYSYLACAGHRREQVACPSVPVREEVVLDALRDKLGRGILDGELVRARARLVKNVFRIEVFSGADEEPRIEVIAWPGERGE